MCMSELKDLETLVLDFFLTSARNGRFNGVRASDAIGGHALEGSFQELLARLVESGSIECVFARRDLNPHIKRLPVLPKDKQIEWLKTESPDNYCLYPSPALLAEKISPIELADRPFSRALLLGEAQLAFATFELGVLGRYRNDPRFVVQFHDYMGDMSISGEYYDSIKAPERDKISVESFGLGLNGDLIPHIIVFYRYLADLTPEHQQYWNSFTAAHVPMCEPYFQSAVVGDWWENRSIRHAIQEEMRLINEMATAAFSKRLFRNEMTDDLSFDLSAFLVPSSDNFASFIHSWDKLLSDNIEKDFFRGKVELTYEQKRSDGRVSVHNKGTISLLREWLEMSVGGKDKKEIISAIIDPMRRIRKLRQQPAHSFLKNEFSHDFHAKRREVLTEILEVVAFLRTILSRNHRARHINVPAWLDSNNIHVF